MFRAIEGVFSTENYDAVIQRFSSRGIQNCSVYLITLAHRFCSILLLFYHLVHNVHHEKKDG
jgi:hypothetical protein